MRHCRPGARRALPALAAATVAVATACAVYELPDGAPRMGDGGSAGDASLGGSAGGGGVSNQQGGAGASLSGAAPQGGSGGGGGSAPGGGGSASGGEGGMTGDAGEGEGGGGGAAGAPEPSDACPRDPDKLQPGTCGCGVPDVATATKSDCAPLKTKLRNRYDFEGSGTTVTDRVGTRHGVVRSAQLSQIDGKGVVLLGGGSSGGYVDLPNDVLAGLENASFEAWLSWGGGDAQQRVFDFGDTTNSAEDSPGFGKSYLFASPKTGGGTAQVGFALDTYTSEQRVTASAALSTSLAQVVVVANDDDDLLQLYVDGEQVAEGPWTSSLSALHVVNAWLGRSQFNADPELSGVFHDFRIYAAALSAAEVASSFAAGADPIYLAY